jgi:hypothetical protein
MRSWLYSRWFFGFLAVVFLLELVARLGEKYGGWTDRNNIAIGLNVIAATLTVWVFIDLQRRGPKSGGGSGG